MLIRLTNHSKNNPKTIDKLIAIKGLPEDWIFRESPEGKELKRPWTADIDKNIPHDIRTFCEPTMMLFRYPPISRESKEVIEKRQVLGIKLDFAMEPGRELWEKIEKFIEGTMPRNELIPKPVLCAKDEHSPFQTYESYRNSTGSLELREADVPLIDLTPFTKKEEPVILIAPEVLESEAPVVEESPAAFQCDECERSYVFEKVLKRHKKVSHKKEKAVA
jgi:hypothetical protein